MAAGYSSNPLWKKLGYKAGLVAHRVGEPGDYEKWLQLPASEPVTWSTRVTPATELVHLFVSDQKELRLHLERLRPKIAPSCAVWVSWPKKSSGVPTDVTEDRIRELALPLGFVDIKVCAVDETWSGLKLVIRKELR